MKSSYGQAGQYLKGQNPKPLTIIYGADPNRNRKIARDYVDLLLGDNARDEMRLERNDWKTLASDQAHLIDASKSIGFFPGLRGILINDLTDASTAVLGDLLAGWNEGDSLVVAQAASLNKSSKLRKAFDNHAQAMMIAVYDDPISSREVDEAIRKAGLGADDAVKEILSAYAQDFGKAALEGELEKLALYHHGEEAILSPQSVMALLPSNVNTAADTIIFNMLSGRSREMLAHLQHAAAQGVTIHQINAGARRLALQLLQVKSNGNPREAMSRLRPPLFGDRRTQFEQFLRIWNVTRLEAALDALSNAEAQMRKGKGHVPDEAFAQRVFLRVALLARP